MDWYTPADEVVLLEPDRVVTRRLVRADEPCFRDHFPGRPVLPGVLGVEAMTRACRRLLEGRAEAGDRWVLGSASAVRFGRFVEPGQWLVCEAGLIKLEAARATCKATARIEGPGLPDDGVPAINARLVLRPVRLLEASQATRGVPTP